MKYEAALDAKVNVLKDDRTTDIGDRLTGDAERNDSDRLCNQGVRPKAAEHMPLHSRARRRPEPMLIVPPMHPIPKVIYQPIVSIMQLPQVRSMLALKNS